MTGRPPNAGFPRPFPEAWASDWGEDDDGRDGAGLWMAFTLGGNRQAVRWVPPGEFWMGSQEGEAEAFDMPSYHHLDTNFHSGAS